MSRTRSDWKSIPSQAKVVRTVRGFHDILLRKANEWGLVRSPELGSPASHTSPRNLLGHVLLQEALKGGLACHEGAIDGNLVTDFRVIGDKIEEIFKVKLAYEVHGMYPTKLYAAEGLMISVGATPGGSGTVEMVTTNEDHIATLQKLSGAIFSPVNPREGLVYALGKGTFGYDLIRVGTAGEPIERGNYTQEVLDGYDHIVQDLQTSAPCGRLMIFAGPPGTGKTFMVRSLLQEVPNCAFVLIPSHLIQDLGSPELSRWSRRSWSTR